VLACSPSSKEQHSFLLECSPSGASGCWGSAGALGSCGPCVSSLWPCSPLPWILTSEWNLTFLLYIDKGSLDAVWRTSGAELHFLQSDTLALCSRTSTLTSHGGAVSPPGTALVQLLGRYTGSPVPGGTRPWGCLRNAIPHPLHEPVCCQHHWPGGEASVLPTSAPQSITLPPCTNQPATSTSI